MCGSALIWWNGELTAQGREELRNGGIQQVLDALRRRLRQDLVTATPRSQGKLHLSDRMDYNTTNPEHNLYHIFLQQVIGEETFTSGWRFTAQDLNPAYLELWTRHVRDVSL